MRGGGGGVGGGGGLRREKKKSNFISARQNFLTGVILIH